MRDSYTLNYAPDEVTYSSTVHLDVGQVGRIFYDYTNDIALRPYAISLKLNFSNF